MNTTDKSLFSLLKKQVGATFSKENEGSPAIEKWKGEEIVAFQEDLFDKVRAKVSEKWFYTHIKKEVEKLPRIDMLNILSEYAGYKNWNDFKSKNTIAGKTSKTTSSKKWILLLPLIGIIGLLSAFFYKPTHQFNFCLIDEDRNDAITTIVDVKIFQHGQSPLYLKTDSLGCFTFRTKEKTVQFVVQSPYHKTDTITRHINTKSNGLVKLRTDDYALMLRYYSEGNKTEWKKRKSQLQKLIADEAEIYQYFNNEMGVELYSKEEFINKLTIPTSSLKNINILDKKYANGKIVKLKFMTK